MKPRVAVLTNIPSTYQVELFDEIAKQARVDLRVWYCAEKDVRRHWEPPRPSHWHRFGRDWRITAHNDQYYLDPRLASEIGAWQPHLAVFSVYSMPAVQIAMWRAGLAGIPWVYWGESVGTGGTGLRVRLARHVALYPIRRWALGLFAVGRRAVLNFRRHLADDRPVLNVPYFSDLRRFSRGSGASSTAGRGSTFLFVGSLVHRKGVDTLARAFSLLVDRVPGVRLLIAGDGAGAQLLDRQLPERAARAVTRQGFVAWQSLPQLYGKGDYLVLPSRYDGWGMVVAEAMASGLPVIGSTAAGAVLDLVQEGITGWQVPPDDPGALEATMRLAVTTNRHRIQWMRRQWPKVARKYDAALCARLFARAVSVVLQSG